MKKVDNNKMRKIKAGSIIKAVVKEKRSAVITARKLELVREVEILR